MHRQNHVSLSGPSVTTFTTPPIEHTGFARWLHKVLHHDGVARREVEEERRLEQLKRLMVSVMEPFMFNMCRRDMQLYLRVLAAEHSDALRRVRFEYFDLLCRMLSESEAMEHLLHVDAILNQ